MGLFLVAIVIALASAKRVFPEYTQTLEIPEGWAPARSSKNPVLPFTVALKQRNTETLSALFNRVSNPRDTQYGKYKSLDEIAEMVRRSP